MEIKNQYQTCPFAQLLEYSDMLKAVKAIASPIKPDIGQNLLYISLSPNLYNFSKDSNDIYYV